MIAPRLGLVSVRCVDRHRVPTERGPPTFSAGSLLSGVPKPPRIVTLAPQTCVGSSDSPGPSARNNPVNPLLDVEDIILNPSLVSFPFPETIYIYMSVSRVLSIAALENVSSLSLSHRSLENNDQRNLT